MRFGIVLLVASVEAGDKACKKPDNCALPENASTNCEIADQIETCSKCADDYELTAGGLKCTKVKAKCTNGTGADSTTAAQNTFENCGSCNAGYYKVTAASADANGNTPVTCIASCKDETTNKYGSNGECKAACDTNMGNNMVSYNNVCMAFCPAGMIQEAASDTDAQKVCVSSCGSANIVNASSVCEVKTTCTCGGAQNGTAATTGNVCYAGQPSCKTCATNFTLSGTECLTNCTCSNGTGATDCATAAAKCASCDTGFEKDGSNACHHACVCALAGKADAGDCTAAGTHKCKEATGDVFHDTQCKATVGATESHALVSGKCESRCLCANGVAGHQCKDANKAANQGCVSCNAGYELTGTGVCTAFATCKDTGGGGTAITNCKTYDTTSKCSKKANSKCSACNDDFQLSTDGQTCTALATCNCTNGTASTAKCAGVEKCTACDEGFELKNSVCEATCGCDNGTGAALGSCTAKNEKKCAKCNSGYHLNRNTLACDNNCVCSHGTKAGTGCSTKGEEKCLGDCKDTTKSKADGKCSTKCTCDNGTAAVDCIQEIEKCSACAEGYALNGDNECKATLCVCPGGVAASDCTKVEEKCASCSAGWNANGTLCEYPAAVDYPCKTTGCAAGSVAGTGCTYPDEIKCVAGTGDSADAAAAKGTKAHGDHFVFKEGSAGDSAKKADQYGACKKTLEETADKVSNNSAADNKATGFAALNLRIGLAGNYATPEFATPKLQFKGAFVSKNMAACVGDGDVVAAADYDAAKVKSDLLVAVGAIAGKLANPDDLATHEAAAREAALANFLTRRPSYRGKVSTKDMQCVGFSIAIYVDSDTPGATAPSKLCNSLGVAANNGTDGYRPIGSDDTKIAAVIAGSEGAKASTSSDWLKSDEEEFYAGNMKRSYSQKFSLDCGKAGCENTVVKSMNAAITAANQGSADNTSGKGKLLVDFETNLAAYTAGADSVKVVLVALGSRRRMMLRRLSSSTLNVTYEAPVSSAAATTGAGTSAQIKNVGMGLQALAAGVCTGTSCGTIMARATGGITVGAVTGVFAHEFDDWKTDVNGIPQFPAVWTKEYADWGATPNAHWDANYIGTLTWEEWRTLHSRDKAEALTAAKSAETKRKAAERALWNPSSSSSDDESSVVVIVVVIVCVLVVGAGGYWYMNHGGGKESGNSA